MFENQNKFATMKAEPEPMPRPGILSALIQAGSGAGPEIATLRPAVMPRPGFGQGVLGFAEQQRLEEERRRREQAAAAGIAAWHQPTPQSPAWPSPAPVPPGPAIQPAPGTAGYNPAWNGLAPGVPQPASYFTATDPAYGYQDYMAVRNSAGL